ncbi:MAG: rhodanese-like domain-containing protein [Verrucomicrobiota bacterium]
MKFRRIMTMLGWVLFLLVVLGTLLWWLAGEGRGVGWAQRVVRDRFPDVPVVTVGELAGWLREGGGRIPVILDARTGEEQSVSMLPGAVAVDPDAGAGEVLGGRDPGRTVVVYCAAGYRGARLARRLRQAGWEDVRNLDGGIFAWGNAGLPLERLGQAVGDVHPHSSLFARMLRNPWVRRAKQ